MELLHQYGSLLIFITAVFGFFMAFGVGANDVSNAMGTSVGSGTITPKQAIIIAMIFEAAGAYLAGGEVTETIKRAGACRPSYSGERAQFTSMMLPYVFQCQA